MSDALTIAKIQQLVDISKKHPRDVEFIREHLSLDNRDFFDQLLKEYEVKVKKSREEKKTASTSPIMITVFNNPKLAAECCIAHAKANKHMNVAILDADRFNPLLNVFLNTRSYIKSVYTHLDYQRTTGLNLLIDASHKHVLTKQYAHHLALRVKGYKHVHYFSGSYLLDDYEYFKLEDFRRVLQFLKSTYDCLIVHVNDFIYDAFTCHALMLSDVNLISCSGYMHDIYQKKKYMDFLEIRQKISEDKNHYVIFDYDKSIHADMHLIKSSLDKVIALPYMKARHQSSGGYGMTKHMKRKVVNQYEDLFNKIRR